MKRIPLSLRYLFSVYVIGILFFTLFRLLLIFKNWNAVQHIPSGNGIMPETFLMGFRFDTVISGYLLALPMAILCITELCGFLSRRVMLGINVLLSLVYPLCFFGCAADIPFFLTYNNRLNVSVLDWTDSPLFMIKMVAEDWGFVGYFLLFVALSVIFIVLITKQYRKYAGHTYEVKGIKNGFTVSKLFITLVAMGLLFLGIRGRVEKKSPIMVGTAYFSEYDFANQAGLNPMFTFISSWLESIKPENQRLHLMEDDKAIQLVQQYLHITPNALNKSYPIARQVQAADSPIHPNVVLVLMESMSASFMAHGGNSSGLTPTLDSLADHGYYFNNFYSAGIHTFNGIFSTLYSFPALMARHTMIGVTIPKYTGLPWLMKQNGYKTMYFTTHDAQFDNVGGFVTANNVDSVISQLDYPSSAILGPLGVPDHFMFDFALPIFNDYYNAHKPFFAAMMTGSNHKPYIVPDGIPFKPRHTDIRNGCVEYADWAIRHFIDTASKQPWYNNTIFVFVADHGTWEGNISNGFPGMPVSLNHIPFIIYSPLLHDSPKMLNGVGGQIDVYPTIAALLHLSYTNNTMGVDLLHDSRPYMYFSADDRVGVADTSSCYIWQNTGKEALYSFARKDKDILSNYKHKADSMKQYAFSMLQTTDWLLLKGKTGAPE